MKRFIVVLLVLQTLVSFLAAQSEAGAIFLLIAPGARAGGMGEAQVAVEKRRQPWPPCAVQSSCAERA